MYDCFRHAKVTNVTLQYFIDGNPKELYTISFANLQSAHDWLAEKKNWNKSVSQMLMRYSYEDK